VNTLVDASAAQAPDAAAQDPLPFVPRKVVIRNTQLVVNLVVKLGVKLGVKRWSAAAQDIHRRHTAPFLSRKDVIRNTERVYTRSSKLPHYSIYYCARC
jgi:hypothetical protein